MSTSHRPTFYPAVGGRSQGGNLATIPTSRVSARDLPSQGTLKRRRLQTQYSDAPLSSNASVIEQAPSLSSLIQLDEKLIATYAEQDKDTDLKSEDDESNNDEEDSGGSSESDDEDEQLQKELEALRKEREETKVKLESKSQLEKLAENLAQTKVAKSWEDEAVFKANAKEVRNAKAVFINDSVRSEFHKRFLSKYIQ
eukprot:Gregarina_sp_Poly_1__1544@NODE_138_length_13117_cov_118_636935_g123_i0_p5_GENE_NODE_138_length_13117_cov_118_636935_g123_i0NODE_138_length_13117_cov_118_636935_g123_i0_p5_ORF_typecomplete_len198_score49_48Cwf_Cwc_15/PF04889_12/6_5e36YL1/PF05764_13/0_027DUF3381/PF11861_8/0_054DUF3498/PF12004_8/0_057AAA_23/PF13476_6/0_14MFMR_assoc/PF16596_5/0_35Sigma70_ner/PF04546_13/0_41DASH_Hsk3/PF08227_11/3_7e02DASH_Hsk3/PF08227_11/2_4Herpes_LMP1/PF05297_11/2_9DNA_pol_phi/PF04931_13/3_4DivIC/PF04977_15/2_3e03Di